MKNLPRYSLNAVPAPIPELAPHTPPTIQPMKPLLCLIRRLNLPAALALWVAIPLHAQSNDPCETVMDCPEEVFLTTSGNGTTADLSVTASNPCIDSVRVQCYLGTRTGTPIQRDTVFPLGTNEVSCIASDAFGNELTNCSFRVVVELDTQSPQLIRPARLIVPCTEPGGAIVEFTAGATDDFDSEPAVTCEPPSGSFFPTGTNTVTCTTRDTAGNRTVEQFEVIVSGGCGETRCLELTPPEDLTVPCTGPSGATVEFDVTGRNSCTGARVPVSCEPPSGSVFPLGITRVICRVDEEGIEGATSFLVEVTDEVPPVIECPGDMVVDAMSPLGAVVNYSVKATDDCTAQPVIRCAPASGTVFPVGETRVLCEAADASGNLVHCTFVVTVNPSKPFTAAQTDADRLELRWTGNAVLESTDRLGGNADWQEVNEPAVEENEEWTIKIPTSETSRYFRWRLLPVVPPADRDGDGLPDSEDRCPDTPMGLAVDETGCALFDLLATPEQALGEEEVQLRNLRNRLLRWPGTEALADVIPAPDESLSTLRFRLIERDYQGALAEANRNVSELEGALAELRRARTERLEEIERRGPFLSDGYADVRNIDHELLDFDRFAKALTSNLEYHRRVSLNLSNVVRAIETPQPRQRVQIQTLDNERGVAVLSDRTRVLLPRPGTEPAPALETIQDAFVEDTQVDMTLVSLPDGSNLALEASATEGVSAQPVAELNPRRLALRVTPVDFGLPNFDLSPRHKLEAYQWGFTESSSRLYLEFNQALVAVPYLTLNGREDYQHWLNISVDLNNDGIYSPMIWKMDATSPPFVLQKGSLPEFQPFSLRVREFRKLVDGSGSAEVVVEEFYAVELNDPGFYIQADYDRTAFELEDTSFKPGHQVAHVIGLGRRFPLTLKPLNEFSFSGTTFTSVGGGTSYPNVGNIGLNEAFAVHNQDPNDTLWFANPNDRPRGIYRPTARGFNNGYFFSYRTALPPIVRDRLHACGGSQPDTYYKIPLAGSYSVSQGNNGSFTHNGWQRFAWDFPKPAFTPVVAARGGVVVDLRSSASESCYLPFLSNPNGTTGGCANCTGAAASNFVYIQHQDGTYAWYGHFRQDGVFVNLNQRIFRGTVLGIVGTTGCSSGNHLHFHVVNSEETTTIPIRFESYILGSVFLPCHRPDSNSTGVSTQ